jgi:hypothetical protein
MTHTGQGTRERPEPRGRQEPSCNVVPGEHLSFIRVPRQRNRGGHAETPSPGIPG